MQFKPLFLLYILLCIIALMDVLFSMRKNTLLKTCILLIISSLFVMNYLSFLSNLSRLQILVVKCVRIVYVCSTMLIVIQQVTVRIPKWIIGLITFSVIFLIGLRVFNFNRIAVEPDTHFASQIFAVGPEFETPIPFARFSVYTLVALVTFLTFYFYRKFLMAISVDDIHHKLISRWILTLVLPFFLLVIFGILGSLNMYDQPASAYLFSVFSFIVIFSILFRPRILNDTRILHTPLSQNAS